MINIYCNSEKCRLSWTVIGVLSQINMLKSGCLQNVKKKTPENLNQSQWHTIAFLNIYSHVHKYFINIFMQCEVQYLNVILDLCLFYSSWKNAKKNYNLIIIWEPLLKVDPFYARCRKTVLCVFDKEKICLVGSLRRQYILYALFKMVQ